MSRWRVFTAARFPREGVGLLTQVLVNNLATAEPERLGAGGRRAGALPPDAPDKAPVPRRLRQRQLLPAPLGLGGDALRTDELCGGPAVGKAGGRGGLQNGVRAAPGSHDRGFVYELRRPFVGQHVLSELFGLRSAPSPGASSRPYPAPHWTATDCFVRVKEWPRRCCGPYRTRGCIAT